MEEALARTGFSKEEMAIVGDRLYTDIETGVRFGITSILVLSGETTALQAQASSMKADMLFGRLADIIPYL